MANVELKIKRSLARISMKVKRDMLEEMYSVKLITWPQLILISYDLGLIKIPKEYLHRMKVKNGEI